MKRILLFGAGLSASTLIKYLLDHSYAESWHLVVVDQDLELILAKLGGHPNATAHAFNALDSQQRLPYIAQADLVISMLPAAHHVDVAKDCIALQKHLVTPSYISAEMRALHDQAKAAGIVILNEIGVDPGIDHMSAMRLIDQIKEEGGVLESFKSYCGGLIAPSSDNNPWHYKFTWNPKNVVLAGQGSAACYREMNELKYLPYHRLFQRLDHIQIEGYGEFEGYVNRDSLNYLETYHIQEVPTIFRGTLRRPPYCQAWDVFVQLGMTDDAYTMKGSAQLTPRQFLNAFLPFETGVSVEDKFLKVVGQRKDLFDLFDFLGLFSDKDVIGVEKASPATLLQKILVEKWRLAPGDKDMIVMYHEIIYTKNDTRYAVNSALVVEGQDERYTAMSNTVGLPVAIATKLILNQQIVERGVTLPVNKELYAPILSELEQFGIIFNESEKVL
ncbi:MAG: saccharopine dehydrogenase family protein [Flavobacteriales bacterium]|jgi:saccharopine dehydrogenase-like NADP-dependent oxidoreductase